VAEGVLDLARAVAVELVLHRLDHRGAQGHRALDRRVDVVHVDHDRHRCPADRLRPQDAHLGKLVGEHHHGVAQFQLGVPELAARRLEPHPFGGAEDGDVEVDRRGGAADVQIRAEPGIALGDGSGGHALPPARIPYGQALTGGAPPHSGRDGRPQGRRRATSLLWRRWRAESQSPVQ
jgi:hypothetical protein